MKFRIYEKLLTEVVGDQGKTLIGEVEANTLDEAIKVAKLMFPGKNDLKLEKS